PGFVIALLARVAVALWARLDPAPHRLVRRAAVRVVFFVRNNLCLGVQLQADGTQMVTQLITDQPCLRIILAVGAGLYQSDALLIVEDVERLPLQTHYTAVSAALAVDLEGTEVDPLRLARRWLPVRNLPLGHLSHALSGSVIGEIGSLRSSAVDHLL